MAYSSQNRPFARSRVFLSTLLTAVLCSLGCHQGASLDSALRVGSTPGPADEVLREIVPVLAKRGVTLKVVSFSDYIQPNLALAAGELDANLYQNVPFMERFNRDRGTRFVSVAKAYLPPMGIYPGRAKSLQALHDGSVIAIPNDPVNSERGLLLLQSAGLLTLKAASDGGSSGPGDVAQNPHHFQLRELEAAQLPRSVGDVDAAVINANFALDAGLRPNKDAMYKEDPGSKYVNILACNAGKENDPRILALVEVLHSDATRAFIQQRYKGSVAPAF